MIYLAFYIFSNQGNFRQFHFRTFHYSYFSAFISLPYDPLETILADCFKGSIIVLISFCVILSLVWLRDQIVNGGGPDWLENVQDDPPLEVRNRKRKV